MTSTHPVPALCVRPGLVDLVHRGGTFRVTRTRGSSSGGGGGGQQRRRSVAVCQSVTGNALMNDPVPTLGPQVTRVGMASFVPSLLSLMLRMLIIDACVHGEESIDIDRQTHTAG